MFFRSIFSAAAPSRNSRGLLDFTFMLEGEEVSLNLKENPHIRPDFPVILANNGRFTRWNSPSNVSGIQLSYRLLNARLQLPQCASNGVTAVLCYAIDMWEFVWWRMDTDIVKHDDVMKWKHFPRYWPSVRGIHQSRWSPSSKASDAEIWCFFFICALNKRLRKQSGGWWFETQSRPLWRHCNGRCKLSL